jgi:hypothetical protein
VSSGIDIITVITVIHIKRCVLRASSSEDENLLYYMRDKLDRACARKKFNPYGNLNECNLSSNQFCLQKVNVEKQKVLLEKLMFAQLLKKNLFRSPGVRLAGHVR